MKKIRQLIVSVQKLLRKYPIHPFLIGYFTVLSYYAAHVSELHSSLLPLPLEVITVFTLLIWGISYLIMRSLFGSSLLTSVFVLLFCSYGYILPWFGEQTYVIGPISIGPNKEALFFLCLLLATAFVALLRFRNLFSSLSFYANLNAIILIALPLTSIIPYITTYHVPKIANVLSANTQSNSQTLPDIYYIVPEDYGANETLQKDYRFDNSGLTDYLTSKGFLVNFDSKTNYVSSAMSLASSLNMDYLDVLSQNLPGNKNDLVTYFPLLRNSKIVQFVHSQGYLYYHLGSWYQPTKVDYAADENLNYSSQILNINRFYLSLLANTALTPFFDNSLPLDLNTTQKNVSLYQFDELGKVANMPGPKFVFAHIIMSHNPFVFDSDCTYHSEGIKPFTKQLQCTDQKLENVIDTILKSEKTPPIIIVQSDEGPHDLPLELSKHPEDPEYTLARERILEALYIPGVKRGEVPTDLSPVNVFRLILDKYLNQKLDLLPNKIFFSNTADSQDQ